MLYILTSFWVLVEIFIFYIFCAEKLKKHKKREICSKIFQKNVFLSLHQNAGRMFIHRKKNSFFLWKNTCPSYLFAMLLIQNIFELLWRIFSFLHFWHSPVWVNSQLAPPLNASCLFCAWCGAHSVWLLPFWKKKYVSY